MLGTIILPLVVIFGSPLPAAPEAFCESFIVRDGAELLCLDTNEVVPSGHWWTEVGPDQGDLQVIYDMSQEWPLNAWQEDEVPPTITMWCETANELADGSLHCVDWDTDYAAGEWSIGSNGIDDGVGYLVQVAR